MNNVFLVLCESLPNQFTEARFAKTGKLTSLDQKVMMMRSRPSRARGLKRVTIRKDESGKYGDSNEVKSYSAPAGQVAQAAPQAFHAATAAQASPMPPPQSRPAPAAPAAPWAMNR